MLEGAKKQNKQTNKENPNLQLLRKLTNILCLHSGFDRMDLRNKVTFYILCYWGWIKLFFFPLRTGGKCRGRELSLVNQFLKNVNSYNNLSVYKSLFYLLLIFSYVFH